MDKKNIIYAIVGKSGTGKTTLCEKVGESLNIPVICSYTTRPMREGETNGKEHYFVTEDKMPPKEEMVAYTYFGKNHYWVEKSQIAHECIYVIDDDGLKMLKESNEYDVYSILITRDNIKIDNDRKNRDIGRFSKDTSKYDCVVENNTSLASAIFKLELAILRGYKKIVENR